jgi:acetolactate synthase I/II/III large subunit
VLVDIPKDVQFATATYTPPHGGQRTAHYQPKVKGDPADHPLVEMMETAERPVFYTGGGVINSGPAPASCCASWSRRRAFPSPRP